MGRITTPSPAPAASTALTHFSHPHELHPTPSLHNQLCAACSLQSTATMYACLPCNFSLHQSCAKLPRNITHPSHGGCTLALLTSPPYDAAAFRCDACKRPGHAWSYHCTRCEYDLHVACASKPMMIKHQAHASCDLHLTFTSPYANADGFSCDICRKIGTKHHWLYRCNSCEFDAHLDCVGGMPPPSQTAHPVLHHLQSLPLPPPAPIYQNPQLAHSVSTGGSQYQVMPQINPANPPQVYNRPAPGPTMGSNLVMAAMQGLVEGAFQGVGQIAVQEVWDGVGGGGESTDGGGDGGGASTM